MVFELGGDGSTSSEGGDGSTSSEGGDLGDISDSDGGGT